MPDNTKFLIAVMTLGLLWASLSAFKAYLSYCANIRAAQMQMEQVRQNNEFYEKSLEAAEKANAALIKAAENISGESALLKTIISKAEHRRDVK